MQEFFLATATAATSYPTWMMNNDIAIATKWEMIPCRLLVPPLLPEALRSYGSVWEKTGEPQPLLKSAVKAGVFLNMKQLDHIYQILKYDLPDKGKGSGKGGGIVKIDHATGLVNLLWPEDPPEEKERMVDAIVGRRISKVKCPNDVIQAVKELGAEAERDFRDLHQCALNQEAVEKERQLRAPTLDRQEQKTYTPAILKSLLPPETAASCNRNPILKRYQAFYPGLLA